MAHSDRPWHRSLIKTGARLLLGGSRAHIQDRFPGLSIIRSANSGRDAQSGPSPQSAQGEVRYRGARVASLFGVELLRERAGETIYVIGSGPSVNGCDLTALEPGSAILLNGAINLAGEQIAAPLAIAVEDERFIWRHFDLMRRKIGAGAICLFSIAVLRAICEHDRGWLADKTILLIDDVRKPYGAARRSIEIIRQLDFVLVNEAGTAGLSLSPDRGVFQGGSVAISALQFAFYCAPKTIGFIGIDISNADQPRFYENSSEAAFSGIARAEARILEHFALARDAAAVRNIVLVNHSPVSALLKYGFGYDDRFAIRSAGGPASPS